MNEAPHTHLHDMIAASEAKPAVMVMGTGSNVGKSTIVAGLCRIFARQGLKVAPFKPQNMSNNAAATPDGGEIGRAQALQAMAARIPASIHMNPVLLKPESDTGAQVILQGRRFGTIRASEYRSRATSLLAPVMESFSILQRDADLVVIEGAGSPAETNLRQGDIANMGFASATQTPAILVGDIDRGGVIANLVGTHAVLPDDERALVRGFLINKFRGDVRLFDDGLVDIAGRTGWPSLGVAPWLPSAARLPAEDALDLTRGGKRGGKMKIAAPLTPRIANFDDLDPLRMERDVELILVRPGEAIPGDCDFVILPGSKSTIADLAFMRDQGWDIDIAAHRRRGGKILGLCGGYQMLGRVIADPDGIERSAQTVAGLGHLDIETILAGEKIVRPVAATHVRSGRTLSGYEIHLGRTQGPDCARPMLRIDGVDDGAQSADGRVAGSYVHGLFSDDSFRAEFLRGFGISSSLDYDATIDRTLDALANHLEAHLDIAAIRAIADQRASAMRR